MSKYAQTDLMAALKAVASWIGKSERFYRKFPEGSPQHTLLRNRIKAMYLVKALLEEELAGPGGKRAAEQYAKEELAAALPPIESMIHKSETAQRKYQEGSNWHQRFQAILEPVYLAKALLLERLSQGTTGE